MDSCCRAHLPGQYFEAFCVCVCVCGPFLHQLCSKSGAAFKVGGVTLSLRNFFVPSQFSASALFAVLFNLKSIRYFLFQKYCQIT